MKETKSKTHEELSIFCVSMHAFTKKVSLIKLAYACWLASIHIKHSRNALNPQYQNFVASFVIFCKKLQMLVKHTDNNSN